MRVFGGGLGSMLSLVVVLAAVAACGEDEAKVSSNSDVYCPGYDDQCGASSCSTVCNDVMPSAFSSCWLYACGAAVNRCDGEEPGNKSILSCAQDQGWNVACQQLQNHCNTCAANAPARCQMVVVANKANECIHLLAALDSSVDGCTDPNPAP